ncbi:ABC transporter permease [Pseudomonas sp. sp1636]|uniref:ABC transporter permease n=1 Tax=Pseudomonas sp. sp1636 TaxID=3036707 RepID=UPI0025A60527|nr:ABC transporter permease [Pseudomonas sp. sp1636]MDM8347492.1 ABC transporter permease [Pseudomonas sp. sp1636]
MTLPRRANTVIPVLALLALVLLWSLDFVSIQPNRIAPGHGLGLLTAVGPAWALLVTGLLLVCPWLALRPSPLRYWLTLAVLFVLLLQLPLSLAWCVARHIGADMPYARVGIGAAGWGLLFLLGLLLIEVQQRIRLARVWLLGMVVALALLLWSLARLGWLEPLALLREYQSRRSQFAAALYSHLALVGGAVGCSLLFGCAIALLLNRYPAAHKGSIGLLSFIQTIPSLALFGLLIAPLSYLSSQFAWLQQLNIRGIGWAPALLALIAYSLLPIVRNTCVALQAVEPSVIDSARGMGMSPAQVFLQVRLPLAMPLIIEGVRVTSIQAIGLTAVAALIGAGGFGTFIFQGLGQSAMDLIILGALPIIALALLADSLFGLLAERFDPGARR